MLIKIILGRRAQTTARIGPPVPRRHRSPGTDFVAGAGRGYHRADDLCSVAFGLFLGLDALPGRRALGPVGCIATISEPPPPLVGGLVPLYFGRELFIFRKRPLRRFLLFYRATESSMVAP